MWFIVTGQYINLIHCAVRCCTVLCGNLCFFAQTIKKLLCTTDFLKEKYGVSVMNLCTDGDSTRRQAYNMFMCHTVSIISDIYLIVGKLPFVDLTVGPNLETANFDAKHMIKRYWNNILRGRCCINGVAVTKTHLKEMFSQNDSSVSYDHILCPKDRQNVPAATDFCLNFIDCISSGVIPYALQAIHSELKMLATVLKGILMFYDYTDATIAEQLEGISSCAYCLFFLYLEN